MADLPPMTAIRVFEAAARHGNFTRAADELAMTQAAVSYQMKILEERLGAPLFVRHGRGMALTGMGEKMAPQIIAAFNSLRQTFRSVRTDNDSILTITAPRTFATNWLAGRLGDFHRAHPDLTVRLDVCDTIVDLASGEFDAAVRCVTEPRPDLVSHFLMRMPLTPLVSPSFLAAHPLTTPEDLFSVPRISSEDEWWDVWFESLPEPARQVRHRKGLAFDSQVLDGHAAIAGHGAAILSPPMFASALAAGLLVQPFPSVAWYDRCCWLVYPETKRALPKVRALRDWLLAAVRDAAVGDTALLERPARLVETAA